MQAVNACFRLRGSHHRSGYWQCLPGTFGPAYGGNRRVAGLRREEVAMLAGVSVDYYVRMERGGLAGASESVLDALADALRLDEAERTHLFALARESAAHGRPRV